MCVQPIFAQTAKPRVVVIPLSGDTQSYTGVDPIEVDNDNNTISLREETPILFKVRGNGFAVKNLNAGTTIETDIWTVEVYDTRNAFNTTTKRFVAPESGYYFLHAVVDQANNITTAVFKISFNIDLNSRFAQTSQNNAPLTEVSGIYQLNAGQQVYVNVRNFSSTENERIDGFGSYFEGYKIR